jgi:hypothetical protein
MPACYTRNIEKIVQKPLHYRRLAGDCLIQSRALDGHYNTGMRLHRDGNSRERIPQFMTEQREEFVLPLSAA